MATVYYAYPDLATVMDGGSIDLYLSSSDLSDGKYGDSYGIFTGLESIASESCFENAASTVYITITILDKISPATCYHYFSTGSSCVFCSNINNLNYLDTSNATSMNFMFYRYIGTSLDLSSFNTSNVTDMAYMFRNCYSLTSLDLNNFNISNVTDMSSMFMNCAALTSLDISNFNTSKVTLMTEVFYNCSNLISLDLSNFDTSNVTNMSDMFDGCSSLTILDLSNFNTSKVTNTAYMFDNCSSLITINSDNFDITNISSSSYMFYGCNKLVGAISYDSTKVDANYANYKTGYFTFTPVSTDITVSFVSKMAGISYDSVTTEEGLLRIYLPFPSKTGYVFRCWTTNEDGTGTQYAGDSYLLTESSVTLYGQWDIVDAEITTDETVLIHYIPYIYRNGHWRKYHANINGEKKFTSMTAYIYPLSMTKYTTWDDVAGKTWDEVDGMTWSTILFKESVE